MDKKERLEVLHRKLHGIPGDDFGIVKIIELFRKEVLNEEGCLERNEHYLDRLNKTANEELKYLSNRRGGAKARKNEFDAFKAQFLADISFELFEMNDQ